MDKGIEVTDSFVQKTDDEARFTLPEMADFLFMYSTYKGISIVVLVFNFSLNLTFYYIKFLNEINVICIT